MQDESFGKVLLFPLIELSKKSISHNQSHNNQTNNHNYLFNITFQNFEFGMFQVRRKIPRYLNHAYKSPEKTQIIFIDNLIINPQFIESQQTHHKRRLH